MRSLLSRIPLLAGALALTLPAALADESVWKAHSIDPRTEDARGADGVRLLDVNGDGLLDVASGWEEARQTRVYLHPGPERVTEPWPKVVVGRGFGPPEDAVFCDLDGNGAVDVISSSEGGKIHVHWAPQDPDDYLEESAWSTEPFPAGFRRGSGMFVVPVQLDGRNGIDLVSGGKEKDLVWFRSPEDPRDLDAWECHVISSEGDDAWTMGIYAADLDGDGDPDLAWTTRFGEAGGVRWLENPGPGPKQRQPWETHKLSRGNRDFSFGDVADVNGDGRPDVVAPEIDGKLHVFLNLGGKEWSDVAIAAPGRKKGAAVGDVNLDGRMDIVVNHVQQDGPAWYESEGDPADPASWRRHGTGAPGGKTDLVRLHDVDGDGDLDILTTIETTELQVMWYENPIR
ncbi:MAG: VCBS repeat-containing protein [Verrucomicrobiales bacterium]